MPSDQVTLWKQAAESFDQRHRQIDANQWSLPTLSPGRNIATLVDHVLEVQARFIGFLGGTAVEDDSWSTIRAKSEATLAAPGVLEGMVDTPAVGTAPREVILAIATNDILIHSWDLARALGVDDTLPIDNLQPAIDGIEAFPPEVRSALFADPLDVADDASPQEHMLAVAGRRS